MKKIKLKLNKAVRLKNALEKSIDEDNILIQQNNSIIEGNSRSVDINEVELLKDLKSELIINLNLIIQEANFKKTKGEDYSNAYYVKKLSEIKRELLHLNRIPTDNGKVVVDKQQIKYEAVLKQQDITSRIKELNKEKEVIQNKLSKFNENIDITFQYDEKLKETIESIGIDL